MVRRSDRSGAAGLPSRSDVVRKIDQAQKDALKLIEEAQLSDARSMHAIQRIKQLAVSAFIEIDELYKTFEVLQNEPGRSALHQQWANERIAALLTQTERAMGQVVSAAIGQIGAEVATPRPKEARKEVIVREVEPPFLKFLRENQTPLFFVGLFVLAILSLLVFGAVWVAIVLPLVWLLFFNSPRWLVLVPIGLVLLIGVFV
jgi:hypothetical protein